MNPLVAKYNRICLLICSLISVALFASAQSDFDVKMPAFVAFNAGFSNYTAPLFGLAAQAGAIPDKKLEGYTFDITVSHPIYKYHCGAVLKFVYGNNSDTVFYQQSQPYTILKGNNASYIQSWCLGGVYYSLCFAGVFIDAHVLAGYSHIKIPETIYIASSYSPSTGGSSDKIDIQECGVDMFSYNIGVGIKIFPGKKFGLLFDADIYNAYKRNGVKAFEQGSVSNRLPTSGNARWSNNLNSSLHVSFISISLGVGYRIGK